MSVKEFTQKNSVAFFYTTIILAILTITFGVMAFCNKNQKFQRNGNFERQGTMQRGSRNFYQNRQGSNLPENQAPSSQATPTDSVAPTAQPIQ